MNKKIKYILNIGIPVLAMIVSILFWILRPEDKIPAWVLIICLSVIYILVYLLIFFGKDYHLPRVISLVEEDDDKYLIVEKSNLLQQGHFISIYYQKSNEEIEILVGRGYIESVHEDGKIQIHIDFVPESEQALDIYKKLHNHKSVLQCIKVRPGLHKRLMMSEGDDNE